MNLRIKPLPFQYFGGVVLLIFLININCAFAQFAIGVAPPRIDIFLDPGSSIVETITMFSEESFEQRIIPAIEDWSLTPTGEFVLLKKEDSSKQSKSYSAADWIVFTDDPFLLSNITDISLNFSLQVPENIPAGTYWTAITLTTEPKDTSINGKQMLSVGKLVVSIYVHVGTTLTSAELVDFYIEEHGGQKQVSALIENNGSSILRFTGQLNIIDTSGNSTTVIDLDERVVLRDSVAEINYLLKDTDISTDSLLLTLLLEDNTNQLKLFGEIPLKN